MLKLITKAQARLQSVRSKEEGATAVEYALVLGLVAIALVIAATGLTGILDDFVEAIGDWMAGQGVG